MPGCTSVQERSEISVWRIDSEDKVLYRIVSEEVEQVVPMYQNQKALDHFLCIDKVDFMDLIEKRIKQRSSCQ